MVTETLWTVAHELITGAERCRLTRTTDGWHLAGRVVAALEGTPIDVDYEVEVDAGWRTRHVHVAVDGLGAEARVLRLSCVSEEWTINGERAPELDGATDVDLGVTPATNTLPIRRLQLDPGQRAEIRVAWVRFPQLEVDVGVQTYERRTGDRWRYSSGSFSADLTLDEHGLVVTYGEGLWRAVPGAR